MTVAELIAKLQQLDPALPVLVGEAELAHGEERLAWHPLEIVDVEPRQGAPACLLY